MSSGSTNAGSGVSATDQHREFMHKLGLAKQSATKVRKQEQLRKATLNQAKKALEKGKKELAALTKQLSSAKGEDKSSLSGLVMQKKKDIETLEKAVETASGTVEYQHKAVLEVLAKQRALELSACPMHDFEKMDIKGQAGALDEILQDNKVTVDRTHPGTVSIDGKVSFDPVALRNIPMDQRAELLAGLAGSPKEQKDVLAKMSKSGEMRLRHPGHADEGQTFLNGKKGAMGTTLTDSLDTLYTNATQLEKYRAFDLKNAYSAGLKEDKTRADRCLEFALRMTPPPGDLYELVNYFEFFNAYCEDMADAKANSLNKTGSDKQKKQSIKELRREARSKLADDQTDNNLNGKTIPDAEFKKVKDCFDKYLQAAKTLGAAGGPVACKFDPNDTSGNRQRVQAVGQSLAFKSVSTAAYHTKKHYGELTSNEKAIKTDGTPEENEVGCYLNGARQAVHKGAAGPSKCAQFGGESHLFPGPRCTAITWIADNKAGLATYFSK
ncbi:MAG: hypothetical protein AB3N09_03115 [Tateyamaria sp.]